MANQDKLREYAATIMARLEDINDIVVDIQGDNASLTHMITGFQRIQSRLNTAAKMASDAEKLATRLKSP